MNENTTTSVYTEEELIDIVNYPYDIDEQMRTLEQQLTNAFTLKYIEENNLHDYLNSKQLNTLYGNEMLLDTVISWANRITKSLVGSNVPSFVDSVRKISDRTTAILSSLKNKFNKKNMSTEQIQLRMNKLGTIRPDVLKQDSYRIDYVEYSVQMKRFEGLGAICSSVSDMADANEVEAFASDKIWDSLASSSNGVVKAEEPVEGTVFRRFVWQPPRHKELDLKKSEWLERDNVDKMMKLIVKVKKDAFDDLTQAAEHIKKQCGTLTAEAQHIRQDNLEEMSINYARTFLVTKLIAAIQTIVLKEINYFTVTGINKLSKSKEFTTKDGGKSDKPEGEKKDVVIQ